MARGIKTQENYFEQYSFASTYMWNIMMREKLILIV